NNDLSQENAPPQLLLLQGGELRSLHLGGQVSWADAYHWKLPLTHYAILYLVVLAGLVCVFVRRSPPDGAIAGEIGGVLHRRRSQAALQRDAALAPPPLGYERYLDWGGHPDWLP